MRWTKRKPPAPLDQRLITRLCLFKRCIDLECRWLECTEILQEYRKVSYHLIGVPVYGWVDIRFID